VIKWYYKGLKRVRIIRDRNLTANIKPESFVVDIGGVYDPITRRFDHHQGDTLTYPNGIKMSSFGQIVSHLIGTKHWYSYLLPWIQGIDGVDNGQRILVQKLGLHTTGEWVNCFNPAYDENQDFDSLFEEAVDIAVLIVEREIQRAIGAYKAFSIVWGAINSIKEPGILILEKFAPWGDVVKSYNTEEPIPIRRVVFPAADPVGQWNVMVVPEQDLIPDEVQSLPEFSFIHKNKFIAGFKSKEEALTAAHMRGNAVQGQV